MSLPDKRISDNVFSGVANQSASKIITVSDGENLRLEDFHVLPMLKERWFSGVVLYADKTPAANANVRLLDGNMSKCNNSYLETKTDEFGRFRVKGFETYAYQVDASTDKKQGQKQLYSKPFVIPQTGESGIIELVLNLFL